ncbi:putative hetero-Diels-Alderase [Pseudocercospora fuligena]|uniref:Putative hetero-Diels-Alderase n=1 Tax=Pseudocercospora fuligena TaxID=685502 RepID=A0A8H6VL25_9PEZI|nr:putative hetero-Diels-Alderase [Pseudocercospora fuligena]
MWHLLAHFFAIASAAATILPHRTIFAFPNTTYYDIENVAVRCNGNILLNLLSEPSLYSLDPSTAGSNATLVHTFENATKLDGIVEYKPDVFAVVAGNALSNGSSTYAIWSIDFNSQPPTANKIADVPGALALNGLTTITGSYSDLLLIADAKMGAIWSLNTTTGLASVAFQDDHFLPTSSIAFGINGIHARNQRLYFATSANNTFGYARINPANGVFLNESVTILAHNTPGNVDFDDFALAPDGRYAYVANHNRNLTRIDTQSGDQDLAVTGLNAPTSAAFDRTNECILYVVTGGQSVNGTISSGMVVEVELCESH